MLDDIELARQHGDLEGGPFAAIAEKLEAVLGRFGLARYGSAGEPFDPAVHEALMHAHSDDVQGPTVGLVLTGRLVKRDTRLALALELVDARDARHLGTSPLRGRPAGSLHAGADDPCRSRRAPSPDAECLF